MLAIGIFTIVIFPVYAQDTGVDTETQTEIPVAEETAAESGLPLNLGNNQIENEEPDVSVSAIGLGDLVKTILVLLLVIAAIYVVMYILRKFSASPIDGSSLIKVVGSKGLMKDSAVHLIEVGNQVFLVGTGSSSVNLISEITDQETIDNIQLNLSSGNSGKNSTFSQRITSFLGRGGTAKTEEQIKKSEEFLRTQRNRLKDL